MSLLCFVVALRRLLSGHVSIKIGTAQSQFYIKYIAMDAPFGFQLPQAILANKRYACGWNLGFIPFILSHVGSA